MAKCHQAWHSEHCQHYPSPRLRSEGERCQGSPLRGWRDPEIRPSPQPVEGKVGSLSHYLQGFALEVIQIFPLDKMRQHTPKHKKLETLKEKKTCFKKLVSIFTTPFHCGFTCHAVNNRSLWLLSQSLSTKTAPDHHPFHRQGLVMCWVNPGFRYHHLPDSCQKKSWKSQMSCTLPKKQ